MCAVSFAGDYIKLGIDSIPAGATNYEIPFLFQRTCLTPYIIAGISNGFTFEAVGDATWEFVSFYPDPEVDFWFTLGGLLFTNGFDGISPDSALVGGAGVGTTGLMITPEDHHMFSFFLDIGPGEGEILIDSAFVFAAGAWKWSGMACGLGGAPDKPLFIDKYGSNANHPIHITIFDPPCGDANMDGVVDIDDPVFLLNYVFVFGPAPNPLLKADCDCSGGGVPVDIDDIVYLMDYILRGGPAPCDFDGDGIPDC